MANSREESVIRLLDTYLQSCVRNIRWFGKPVGREGAEAAWCPDL